LLDMTKKSDMWTLIYQMACKTLEAGSGTVDVDVDFDAKIEDADITCVCPECNESIETVGEASGHVDTNVKVDRTSPEFPEEYDSEDVKKVRDFALKQLVDSRIEEDAKQKEIK